MTRKMTFGIIVTNRSFFPAHLVGEERANILKLMNDLGHEAVILGEGETAHGAVVTREEAEKCAALFRSRREDIDGIVAVLPNFGEETGVADAIRLAELHVPVLVQACDDSMDAMGLDNRRDAFCGKLSVCNNLYQRGIPFTNTTLHTCKIMSPEFRADMERFAAVCRVARGMKGARFLAVGARPAAFQTVRYSEKLLEASGVSVDTVDLSEIIAEARAMEEGNMAVRGKIAEISAYGSVLPGVSEEKLTRQAKLCLAIERRVAEGRYDGSAVQCWDSIQNNYGCATCLSMSMMGERGLPSACEMDVTGAVTMRALGLASGSPAGYLDWNNNYTEDRDVCVCLHCSNFPKSFFGEGAEIEIGNLDVLATTIGAEKCFGACKGSVQPGPMTFAKITTDDRNGKIKAYVGEGEFLPGAAPTPGGVALCRVPGLQRLLQHLCAAGFEHHVSMTRGHCADAVAEAFEKYLGWEVYRHV